MKKTIALLLALTLVLSLGLTACGPQSADAPSPSPTAPAADTTQPTEAPTPSPEPSESPAADKVTVNFAVLSGPTGVGAAKLMADSEAGTTQNDYNITVEADNSAVTTKLANGELDIAAVATNVASNLYHKTNGKVQICAINTLGVLYILSKGVDETLNTLMDLEGRTVYAFGQGANPEYVLNYLLTENGVDPANVDIQWKGAPDEVTAAMLQAEGPAICMLPVPAATALTVKSEGNIQPVFDLSAEWDSLMNGSQLTMGCVVVRTEFAQEHPEAVKTFLEEYRQSIEYVNANGDDVGELVAGYGLAPSAAIAKKAIPQCNLVCYTGIDMREAIQGYYEVLCAADPTSIGGGIPDDGFYFLGE